MTYLIITQRFSEDLSGRVGGGGLDVLVLNTIIDNISGNFRFEFVKRGFILSECNQDYNKLPVCQNN